MNLVLFKKLHQDTKVPTKAYNSAGFDLFPLEKGCIEPGQQANIRLGFATEFPSGYAAIVDDRGGTGNQGISHMAGVIDADYRGEWVVILRNFSQNVFWFGPEKAVAQVLFIQVESPEWKESELSGTSRGAGKFGSSDKVKDLSVGNVLDLQQKGA